MSQHKANNDNGSSFLQGMEQRKKSFLFAVTAMTFAQFIISFSDLWLDWQIVFLLGLVNLAALVGLLVNTIRDDAERPGASGANASLRNGFFLASGIAILGLLGLLILGGSIFSPLYYLGSIAVLTITAIRAKDDRGSGSDQAIETTKKSGGLL